MHAKKQTLCYLLDILNAKVFEIDIFKQPLLMNNDGTGF